MVVMNAQVSMYHVYARAICHYTWPSMLRLFIYCTIIDTLLWVWVVLCDSSNTEHQYKS